MPSTQAFDDPLLPFWFKLFWPIIKLIARFSPSTLGDEECGERVISYSGSAYPARGSAETEDLKDRNVCEASDGTKGGGAYKLNWDGEAMLCNKEFERLRKEGMPEKVWAHTTKAFEEIEAGRKFLE